MNDYGKTQVIGNAEKLASLPDDLEHFDFVSSPISRARETMEIVRQTLGLPKKEYSVDDRLKELDYGEFSRHTWDELRELRPHDVTSRYDNSWTYVIPKGECYAMLSKRVLSWFHELERDTVVAATLVSAVFCKDISKSTRNRTSLFSKPRKTGCWCSTKLT